MRMKNKYENSYLESSGRRILVRISDPLPLIGHIAFGIIDRGSNILQVRPFSACPFSCVFCSVDAGPLSRSRIAEFIVDLDHLIEWVMYALRHKISKKIHILIDGVGEPILYPRIVDLVARLREIERIDEIAIETRGSIRNPRLYRRLWEAGLNRINISIDTLDPQKASRLTNTNWYSLDQVLEVITEANSIGLDITLTPLWIPGVNDEDLISLIEWVKKNIRNKRSPSIAIQKYIAHKRGRKIPGVREVGWNYFYEFLEKLEKKTGVRLILRPEDFNIKPDMPVPKTMRTGESIRMKLYSVGWLRGEYIAYARERVVTLVSEEKLENIRDMEIIGRVIHDKDNIYIARLD
ncbi:MAG: radical SAM protein [Sulfolobales archaeon]